MRSYVHLLISLLIPLGALFIVSAIFYFKTEYNITQSIRLGVLYGVFIALAISPVLALMLMIMRWKRQPQTDIFSGVKNRKKKHQNVSQKQTKYTPNVNSSDTSLTPTDTEPAQLGENIILLMDTAVTFEVLMYAIADQKLGKLTESDESRGIIIIKTKKSIIKMKISLLTTHTSRIQIDTNHNDKETIQKIIKYVKEKEYSFTQY